MSVFYRIYTEQNDLDADLDDFNLDLHPDDEPFSFCLQGRLIVQYNKLRNIVDRNPDKFALCLQGICSWFAPILCIYLLL